MKIIETKQYIFDNEDRRLLSIEITDNPCNNCWLKDKKGSCCTAGRKYNEIIKPYKERNIYDLALKFKLIHELQRHMINIKTEIEKINKEIQETGIYN